VTEVNERTVAFRAACDCGWLGETVRPRVASDTPDYDSAWPEWEHVPALEAEWMAHTDPLRRGPSQGAWGRPCSPHPPVAVRIPIQSRHDHTGDSGPTRGLPFGRWITLAGGAESGVRPRPRSR
jgi:hypothetical protein